MDVAVKGRERFDHLPVYQTSVAKPLQNARAVLEEALRRAQEKPKGAYEEPKEEERAGIWADVKKSVLTGISYIIPVIVAGGMINAFAVLLAQTFGFRG